MINFGLLFMFGFFGGMGANKLLEGKVGQGMLCLFLSFIALVAWGL